MTRVVGFLLLPGFSLMSYASAVEPLRAANTLTGRDLYAWQHVGIEGDLVAASNGARLALDDRVGTTAAFDLVLVCAAGNPGEFDHAGTLRWLRQVAARGIPVAGISGGPMILARAGLLQGYRCTVHWEHIPAMGETWPELDLHNSLFEIDRNRLTCAGGTAALDMMCTVIAADHGQALANAVSEWLLQSQPRHGRSHQRLGLRDRYGVSHPRLLQALEIMESAVEEPLAFPALAAQVGLSKRQLERLAREHLGTTVRDLYLGIRLQRARVLLRQTSMPVLDVGVACGFSSASHFSRQYRHRYGHSPRAERGGGSIRSSAIGRV